MFLHFTEDSYEKALIGLFQEMGYEYLYGPDIERDYQEPYYKDQLWASLPLVNPSKHPNAIAEAIKKLTSIDTGDLSAVVGENLLERSIFSFDRIFSKIGHENVHEFVIFHAVIPPYGLSADSTSGIGKKVYGPEKRPVVSIIE